MQKSHKTKETRDGQQSLARKKFYKKTDCQNNSSSGSNGNLPGQEKKNRFNISLPNRPSHGGRYNCLSLLKEKKKTQKMLRATEIALTNMLCKIFESMTNKRLVWYLKKKRKIDARQFSFRNRNRTIDTISKNKNKNP